MKIDVTKEIKDFEGNVLQVPTLNNQTKAATIRWACVNALMGIYQDEQNIAGEEKLKRYLLAQKVQKQKTPELASEEITLIKQLVGKNFGPPVVGPVFQVLEGKALHLVEDGDDEEEIKPAAAAAPDEKAMLS